VTIIITSGHSASGFQIAHATLSLAGLGAPHSFGPEAHTPMRLHEDIIRIQEEENGPPLTQLAPSRPWHARGTDLLAANGGRAHWGWADSYAMWLMDFWTINEPRARFVLVYSSPECAIGEQLLEGPEQIEVVADLLHKWSIANTELLRFHLRHPGKCLLVNSEALIGHSDTFLAKVNDAFACTFDAGAAVVSASAPHSLVAAALAKPFTDNSREATSLYRELESASDLPLGTASARHLREAAWTEYFTGGAAKAPSDTHAQNAAQLEHENKLLLLELEQAKQELDSLFIKCENFAAARHSVLRLVDQTTRPVEVCIDLRHDVHGENWYEAEMDGRWAGPRDVSTVRIFPVCWERLEVRIEVIDGMDVEILSSTSLSLNGVPIRTAPDWVGFPCLLVGQFEPASIPEAPLWEFKFHFPKLLSPSDVGAVDQRRLALRIQSMTLRRIQGLDERLFRS
jgi:hypothetical protein